MLYRPGPYSILSTDVSIGQQTKRKRSWSRAVFSNLQRKGLEKRFEVQKYVTKPDRRQLAAMLGLTDAQVSWRVCEQTDGEGRNVFKGEGVLSRTSVFLFTLPGGISLNHDN